MMVGSLHMRDETSGFGLGRLLVLVQRCVPTSTLASCRMQGCVADPQLCTSVADLCSSLENGCRRERLLFYHLACLDNPDSYPWQHLEQCP
eukprot:4430136-Amphidinium_carterae.2